MAAAQGEHGMRDIPLYGAKLVATIGLVRLKAVEWCSVKEISIG